MALRPSTAARSRLMAGASLKQLLQGGKLKIYSGAQPTSGDDAPTGTLLVTITDNSGAHTQEVRATGTITLSSGSSGSVDAVSVGGLALIDTAVPYNTSLTQTAADLAAMINASQQVPKWSATSSGAVVTITAPRGMGALANSLTVTGTLTTLTASYGNTSGGVTAVNGLKFNDGSGGAISKRSTQTWSGVVANSGTAGWFRFEGAVADSGAADTTEGQVRVDGSVSTSGAQLNMSNTSLTALATETITAFSLSLPTL